MEFENLQIEVPTTEDNVEKPDKTLNPAWEKKYYNKSKGFVVGFDIGSEEVLKRKESRAKRFGLKATEAEKIDHNDPFFNIDPMKIEFPPVIEAAFADERPDTLHLYGVNRMSTKDVFEYFKDHGPDTMEWIDDQSCNVVWETESMAKTAMRAMSRSYDDLKEMKNDIADEDVSLESENGDEAKLVWRIAKPHTKANRLFLRQATVEDRKLPGAAKRSLYYLIHGHGRGAKRGVVSSSRKRRMEQANDFLRESLKSKNPEVQFLSVNDDKKSDDDSEEGMDVDVDEGIPTKKRRDLSEGGRMYSDTIRSSSADKSMFGRSKKEENLRIEVSNIRTNSPKWTSKKKNQHRREGSSSSDESGEDIPSDESNSGEFFKRSSSKKTDSKDAVDVHKHDSDDDLRVQIKSTDLRAKIENRNPANKDQSDLRDKLRKKKKHLGLSKEQLNLCIEVTEVSDED